MATLYTHQESNIAKTWALLGVFFVLIIAIGWIFSQVYGDSSFLIGAVILSMVLNIGSYWFSDKVALSIARARPADETEFLELHRIVENLAITAGLPRPRIYIIDDPAPNAFATGRNKEHAVVAVTTGLLSIMNRTELEGVISHELSHVGNRDILLSTIVVVLVGMVSLLSHFFLRFGGRIRGGRDNKAGSLFLILGLVFAILSPIAATLLQLAISRKREFLADASGALLTRYPEGLASALEKIGRYQTPMQSANNATAHLFISNPFGARAMRGMSRLFQTHPLIEERISILRDMKVDSKLTPLACYGAPLREGL